MLNGADEGMGTMINSEDILEFLKGNKQDFFERFSVIEIGLFGSYLNGESGEDSDIDILVRFKTPTFDNYMNLKFYLEEVFQKPVDLVLVDSLKPRLKPIIEHEVAYA